MKLTKNTQIVHLMHENNQLKSELESTKVMFAVQFKAKNKEIETLKSDHEKQIKIAVDDFIECDKKRIEQTKKCEKLASELFHLKVAHGELETVLADEKFRSDVKTIRIDDLEKRKLVRLSLWIGGLRK